MAKTLVGTRIRQRRKQKKLKQADVARLAGISASYLNLIEHNKRGIAGKVLLDIAAVLNVSIGELKDGAQATLVQELQKTAAQSDSILEITQIEDLIGRFPGWAHKIAGQRSEISRLEQTVERLSDRLTHDPFLSESLHEVLSNVTAIRSVSSILAKTEDMLPAQQSRFHANLLEESQRLAETSQGLVAYFDQMSQTRPRPTTPLEEFDAFLEQNDYAFEWLFEADRGALGAFISQSDVLTVDTSRSLAAVFLNRLQNTLSILPTDRFLSAAHDTDFAPDILAEKFDCRLIDVFHRLAFMPAGQGIPAFGLVACDISGAILLRKSLPGFSLPRHGAACPVWPLYQSFAQPNTPQRSLLQNPENSHFLAFTLCIDSRPQNFNAPPLWQSTMLFRSAPIADVAKLDTAMNVGSNCKICPRALCSARREPSIYDRSA